MSLDSKDKTLTGRELSQLLNEHVLPGLRRQCAELLSERYIRSPMGAVEARARAIKEVTGLDIGKITNEFEKARESYKRSEEVLQEWASRGEAALYHRGAHEVAIRLLAEGRDLSYERDKIEKDYRLKHQRWEAASTTIQRPENVTKIERKQNELLALDAEERSRYQTHLKSVLAQEREALRLYSQAELRPEDRFGIELKNGQITRVKCLSKERSRDGNALDLTRS